MAGIKALRKIQLGAEAIYNTKVPTTAIWRGMGLGDDKREVTIVEEEIGIATPTTRAYVPKEEGEVVLDPVEVIFQQVAYPLEAGIQLATPTQDGAGTGYIREYSLPETAQNVIQSYTIQGGDDQGQIEFGGSFVKSFKIAGNAGEGIMIDATWGAATAARGTGFDAATFPSVIPSDHAIFGGSRFYLDDVDGTIGTTLVESTLLSFELDVTTGLKAKYTNKAKGGDFIYFDKGEFSATLKLVYEHNALTENQERVNYEEATARQVRLIFEGTALGTPETYSFKTLQIDAAGVYTEYPYGDVDGNDTIEATLQIGYDIAAALAMNILVVNELATLP